VASLQARHQTSCALGAKAWTRGEPDARTGCTCKPTYYVIASLGRGGRRSVGKNFQLAKRELTATQASQDKHEWHPEDSRLFSEWADVWFDSLRRPNENTKRSYVSTLDYAKRCFGEKQLRKVHVNDVQACLASMTREVKEADGTTKTEPISASTQAKHLRVLSAVFKVAVRQGLISRNPVDALDVSQRPQPERNEAPYFTDDEIPRLLAALDDFDRPLVKLALLTGMRLGELIALRWSHVDLLNATIHVRVAYTDGIGVGSPKSKRSIRDVELTEQAVAVLKGLLRAQGVQDDDALVFPPQTPTSDGYRRGYDVPKRALYPAIKKAGVSRSGSHLTPPTKADRTFHSLRHTFARVALENGVELTWLSRQMGHSSTQVTDQRYGHWSKAARKREVAKLEGAWVL
jgi:integrase